MTKVERQIVIDAVLERQKATLYYYKEAQETGNWKDHEIASEAFRAVRELAESLGINK